MRRHNSGTGQANGSASACRLPIRRNRAGWSEEAPQAVVLAVAFAFVIGVFFGFYPARKAARLNPVEALRFE